VLLSSFDFNHPFRFRITVMGRMKVYGDSWNLPEVQDLRNPFVDLLTSRGAGAPRNASPDRDLLSKPKLSSPAKTGAVTPAKAVQLVTTRGRRTVNV